MNLTSHYNGMISQHNKAKSDQYKKLKENINTKPFSNRHKQNIHFITENHVCLNTSPPKRDIKTITVINPIPSLIKGLQNKDSQRKMRSLDLSNDRRSKIPSRHNNTSPKTKTQIPVAPKDKKKLYLNNNETINNNNNSKRSRNNSYGGDLPECKSSNIVAQYQKNSAILTARLENKNNTNTNTNNNNNNLNSISINNNNKTFVNHYINNHIKKSPRILLKSKIININHSNSIHMNHCIPNDNNSHRILYSSKIPSKSLCSRLSIPFHKTRQTNINLAIPFPNTKIILKENALPTDCETNQNLNNHNLKVEKIIPKLHECYSNSDEDDTIIQSNITTTTIEDYISCETSLESKTSKNQPEEEHKGSLKIHSFQCESNFIKFQHISKPTHEIGSHHQVHHPFQRVRHLNDDNNNPLKNIEIIFKYNNIYSKSQTKLNTTIKEKVFPYSRFKSKEEANKFYKQYVFIKSQYIQEIEKDLPRTIPHNCNFKQNEIMYNNLNFILNVYSFANENIGYAQGINFIVANSLLIFKDNVEVFYFVDGLIRKLNLEDFYGINNKVRNKIDGFGKVVQKYLPKLNNYLIENGVSHEFVTVHWALTLFSNTMEKNLMFCIWDFMILYGWDFFNAFIVVVLSKFEKELFKTQFDKLNQYLKSLLKNTGFQKDFKIIIYKSIEMMNHMKKRINDI